MFKTKTLTALIFSTALLSHASNYTAPLEETKHNLIKKEILKDRLFSEVTIHKVPIKELSANELRTQLFNSDAFNTCSQDGIVLQAIPKMPGAASAIDMGLIRYVGEQVWKIIEKSKPSLDLATKSANVFPRGISCWEDLELWQMPVSQYYEVNYKNKMLMDVVKFRFRITYVPGGQYNGKGLYLTNVRVEPSEIVLKPFYNLDSEVEVLNAFNIGTKDNPVAGVLVDLKWTISTMVQTSHQNFQFFVSGDGKLQTY